MRNLRITVTVAASFAVIAVIVDGLAAAVGHPFGSTSLLWIGTVIAAVFVIVALGLLLFADLVGGQERLRQEIELLGQDRRQLTDQLAERITEAVREALETAVAEARSEGYGEGFLKGSNGGPRRGGNVTSITPRPL
jgi:hypothetical protein